MRCSPVPGQQLGDALHRVIGDAGEDIGEPGAGIDVVEFAGFDQRIDGGRPSATGVAAAEGPVFAPNRNGAHGAFSGVVAHADAAVVEEPRERGPSLQAVVDGFRDRCLRG